MDSCTRTPVTFRELEGLEGQQMAAVFGTQLRFIEAIPGNIIIPSPFAAVGQRIQNFKVRPEDVWIMSYPRTGSNWLQEMVWLIGHDLNFEEAKKTQLSHRSVLIEGSAVSGHLYGEWGAKPENTVDLLEHMDSPRHIKSHLPWNFLPGQLETVKAKMVYVARNPKDTCVSLYLFLKMTINLQIPFEMFCEAFLSGRVPCGNFFHHVLTYWNLRNEPNFLFLKYEDMKKNLEGSVRQVAEFLEKNLSDEQVQQLTDHLSFQKMSRNRSINREGIMEALAGPDHKSKLSYGFLRKGEVGDWKNHMSPEIIAKFDAWTEANLKETGLSFD